MILFKSCLFSHDPPEFMDSPLDRGHFLSELTFSWITKLLRLGNKRPLQQTDLYSIPKHLESQKLTTAFQTSFRKKNGRLVAALYDCFGVKWLLAGFLRLAKDLSFIFMTTFALPRLLVQISNGSSIFEIMCSFGLILGIQIFGSLCLNYYFYLTMTVGFCARTVLANALFQKGLRLSHSSKLQFSNSKILNMIATDTLRIDLVCGYLHFLWAAVILLFFIIITVMNQLGKLPLIGISLILILIPIQSTMMKKMRSIREKVSGFTDRRLKKTAEIVEGIRVIKYYVWERAFFNQLIDIRNQELGMIARLKLLRCFMFSFTMSIPVISIIVTFGIYLTNNLNRDTKNILISYNQMLMIQFILILYPVSINFLADALAAIKRIQEFLNATESSFVPTIEEGVGIKIEDAIFSWEEKDLQDKFEISASFHIKHGQLGIITGRVGSGKSTLLNGLIGEIPMLNGSVKLDGTIGYCSQQAWIQNKSIRDNILFGKEFEEEKYRQCLALSSLDRDIQAFPGGDLTEIGERGVNLSGGQKQRISIARLIYCDPDIVIMDDPFSALDYSVGNRIFHECILDHFKNKTRIISTHRLQFSAEADLILFMKEGKIKEQGSLKELMLNKTEFFELFNSGIQLSDTNEIIVQEEQVIKTSKKESSKLISIEERREGKLEFGIFKYFFSKGTTPSMIILILTILVMYQIFGTFSFFWPKHWIRNTYDLSDAKYQIVYGIIGLSVAITSVLFSIGIMNLSIKASKSVHLGAISSLIKGNISFFDSNPAGRILSRFSNDLDLLDNTLSDSLNSFLTTFVSVVVSIIMSVMNPFSIIVYGIFGLILFYIQNMYRNNSRELKRLDSLSRSPFYSFINESLSGSINIQIFNLKSLFESDAYELCNKNSSSSFLQLVSQRWLALRVECYGSFLVTFAAIVVHFTTSSDATNEINAEYVGTIYGLLLSLIDRLNWCIRQAVEFETSMNSVERLKFYEDGIETEEINFDQVLLKPKIEEWLPMGVVNFQNVSMKYRNDLDFVLRDLNFNIRAGEKFAIVGRTGSGKSTVIQCLFRFFEITQGSILIDSVDIGTIPLEVLRRNMAVIPQDPLLFQGTIRYNIDPLNEYDDSEIWNVLERSSLRVAIRSLEMDVSSEGQNFSVGQRQLICLARALIKKTKIIVLDEATASVDGQTDLFIRETLVKECRDCTIIAIAHRLDTIKDYDTVIVLDNGTIIEQGNPIKLLSDHKSIFHQMYQQTK